MNCLLKNPVYDKPIGILTCQGLEQYKEQDRALIQSLSQLGLNAENVIWDQPANWNHYQAIVVSSTWDYFINPQQLQRFLDVLRGIHFTCVPIFNTLATIEWNCKKTYLKEVAQQGIPTLETLWLSKNQLSDLRSLLAQRKDEKYVIKPVMSAGGLHTIRFCLNEVEKTIQECQKLDVDQWMVQPFASEIIEEGEYSFIYLDRQFSHCVLKKPMPGEFLTGAKHTSLNYSANPSPQILKQAQKIIDLFAHSTLITRLDGILRGKDLVVMEIEMIEPYLYSHLTSGFADKLAKSLFTKIRTKF